MRPKPPKLKPKWLKKKPSLKGPGDPDVQITASPRPVNPIIGCVVNGPGEARETDIGLTGGGQGNHMIYLNGVTDHKIKDEKIIEHIVELVEAKAAEIEAEMAKEKAVA